MERIKLLTKETAPEKSKKVLEEIGQGGARIINIFKVMANSPVVLKSFIEFHKVLAESNLEPDLIERIAIRLAVMNSCEYCLAAHSYSGSKILSQEEILLNREGKSADAKSQAALDFAASVMKNSGKISDEDFEKIKNAGFSDGEILEIVTVVSLNFLTNAINNVSGTKVDFPKP